MPLPKILQLPLLLIAACLIAGVYGSIHNQISYSVSSEYFTEFKFHQFNIPDNTPNRLGAAWVGWYASWWMGAIIAALILPFGLLIERAERYFVVMMQVFGWVIMTAFGMGLLGLALSFLLVSPDRVGEFDRYGNDIHDDVAFVRAGSMHNASYVGGLLGVIVGAWRIVRELVQNRQSRRQRRALERKSESPS